MRQDVAAKVVPPLPMRDAASRRDEEGCQTASSGLSMKPDENFLLATWGYLASFLGDQMEHFVTVRGGGRASVATHRSHSER